MYIAYKRVGAARLMLRYPEIYELLASGRIHLSGLMVLKPHFNPDDWQELLLAASGKSKRQIEQLEEQRRRGNSRCEECGPQEREPQNHEIEHCELHAPFELHAPCQKHAKTPAEPQDPDPNLGTRAKPRSRYEPAAVGRAAGRETPDNARS